MRPLRPARVWLFLKERCYKRVFGAMGPLSMVKCLKLLVKVPWPLIAFRGPSGASGAMVKILCQ